MLNALKDSLLSLIYPRECKICSSPVESAADGYACSDCWRQTRVFRGTENLCSKCGCFLSDAVQSSAARCGRCDAHHYDSASSLGVYERALAASVIGLKTSPWLPRRLIGEFKKRNFASSDLIVPVPLSRQRRIERGFNQAETIAAAISRLHGIRLDAGSLARDVHTQMHRVGMDEKARDLLVRKAFSVARPRLIADKNVLLVDDVMTSGATASHCARLLKANGAGRVEVFTLARATIEGMR